MSNVIHLRKSTHQEVAGTLEKLGQLVANGGVTGLMYVIAHRGGHKAGMSGVYRDDPSRTIQVASTAMQKLYKYEARKRLNPMTASHFVHGIDG